MQNSNRFIRIFYSILTFQNLLLIKKSVALIIHVTRHVEVCKLVYQPEQATHFKFFVVIDTNDLSLTRVKV